MRSEANAKKWIDHVEAWQKSGIIQSEYCRLNQLCIKSFSNWKVKLAKQAQKPLSTTDADIPVFTSSPTSVPLIPVAISEQIESLTKAEPNTSQSLNSGFSGITLVLKSDYQISLDIGFHPDTLKNLLQLFAE